MKKNYKTTLCGILVALTTLQLEISNGASLTDWKAWILPVLIAALGYLTKDATPET